MRLSSFLVLFILLFLSSCVSIEKPYKTVFGADGFKQLEKNAQTHKNAQLAIEYIQGYEDYYFDKLKSLACVNKSGVIEKNCLERKYNEKYHIENIEDAVGIKNMQKIKQYKSSLILHNKNNYVHSTILYDDKKNGSLVAMKYNDDYMLTYIKGVHGMVGEEFNTEYLQYMGIKTYNKQDIPINIQYEGQQGYGYADKDVNNDVNMSYHSKGVKVNNKNTTNEVHSFKKASNQFIKDAKALEKYKDNEYSTGDIKIPLDYIEYKASLRYIDYLKKNKKISNTLYTKAKNKLDKNSQTEPTYDLYKKGKEFYLSEDTKKRLGSIIVTAVFLTLYYSYVQHT